MKRVALLSIAQVLLLSCAQSPPPRAANVPMTEPEKIQHLIGVVAQLHDAQFIRQGILYNCGTAAQFMQGKWDWKSSEIHNARDFVRVCSAGGSGEGEPYFIRFKDGAQVTSKEFLTTELNKIDSQLASANH